MCDCFYECGPEEGWEPGGDARDFQYPTEHWGGAPGRADLPFYHRSPPAPGRPPVTGGLSNVTSRDPGREAPLGHCACALGLRPPQEESSSNCGGGGQATGGKRVWSRPPGLRGLGPTWKGGDREGRLSRPAEGFRGFGGQESGCTVALQGSLASRAVAALPSRLLREGFPIGCLI